jgi:soluble lytic murein transglycosylase-like protein
MFAFVIITVLFIAAMFIAASALEPENPAPKPSPTPDPQELKCSVIYDVPLSEDLQIFAQEICDYYKVDFNLVLAVIAVESGFRSTAYNEKTDCCGLMQVNAVNLPVLREKLGVTDLFDSYENVLSGIYILRYALNYGGDTVHALMIYNNGLSGAKKLFYKGVHSTEYSRKVLEARDSLQLRERIYEEV